MWWGHSFLSWYPFHSLGSGTRLPVFFEWPVTAEGLTFSPPLFLRRHHPTSGSVPDHMAMHSILSIPYSEVSSSVTPQAFTISLKNLASNSLPWSEYLQRHRTAIYLPLTEMCNHQSQMNHGLQFYLGPLLAIGHQTLYLSFCDR